MQQVHDDLFKIILVGDAGVGKTNIVHKFMKGNEQSNQHITPTIGVQFATKMVQLQDGKKIKIQIWDTAGQEQYKSITMAHYRKALGALVVFDITRNETFKNLPKWIDSIRDQAEGAVIMIVGNKIDARDKQTVNPIEARRFAKNAKAFYEETSALTNQNIENTFRTLLEEIHKLRKEQQIKEDNIGFRINNYAGNKDQKCQC